MEERDELGGGKKWKNFKADDDYLNIKKKQNHTQGYYKYLKKIKERKKKKQSKSAKSERVDWGGISGFSSLNKS